MVLKLALKVVVMMVVIVVDVIMMMNKHNLYSCKNDILKI
jgi:hypothetical protein